MTLNLERSRLAFNTASGKENTATKVQGRLPMNPNLKISDSDSEPKLGPEYMGHLAEVIRIQKENM